MQLITEGREDSLAASPTFANWKLSRKLIQRHIKLFGEGLSQMEDILSQLMTTLVAQVKAHENKAIDLRDTIYNMTVGEVYTLLTVRYSRADSKRLEMVKT